MSMIKQVAAHRAALVTVIDEFEKTGLDALKTLNANYQSSIKALEESQREAVGRLKAQIAEQYGEASDADIQVVAKAPVRAPEAEEGGIAVTVTSG